jgi:chaperone modulatory protein CbpM
MSVYEIHSIEVLGEHPISLVEIIACTHVERARVIEMVDAGLLEPDGAAIEEWRFAPRDLQRLRAAQRLITDLGVNLSGAALILDLIEERDALLTRAEMFRRMIDGE